MRLTVIAGLVVATTVAVFGFVQAQVPDDSSPLIPRQETPNPKLPEAPAGKNLVPLPNYKPKPGDRLYLFSEIGKTAITKDRFDLATVIKAGIANDVVGAQQLKDQQRVFLVTTGTQVLVLDTDTLNYKGSEYTACQVRFVDGPFADQSAWCVADEVVKLVAVPKSKAQLKAEADRDKPRVAETVNQSADQKAAALLKIAQNLEKDGKTKPALENYREIVKIAPNSASAKTAKGRIEAMSKK